MYINNVELEILKEIALYHPCCMLFSRVDGTILWANKKFCDWSGYTLNELEKMTWMHLSVEDDDLDADIASAGMLSAASPTYTVRKQYRPKNDRPVHGNLHVTRAPLIGEMQFAFCVWEPLKNGSAEAFTLAVEHTTKASAAMAELTREIQKLTHRDSDEYWIISTIRTARKHPRVVVMLLVLLLSAFSANGVNSLIELAQRLGFLQAPAVEPKSVMFPDPMQPIAMPPGGSKADLTVQLPNGSTVSWNRPPVESYPMWHNAEKM